jgi:hypothetical protein
MQAIESVEDFATNEGIDSALKGVCALKLCKRKTAVNNVNNLLIIPILRTPMQISL